MRILAFAALLALSMPMRADDADLTSADFDPQNPATLPAPKQDPGQTTQDFTVQDKGPVHEAFAKPDQKDPQPPAKVQKAPPPLVPEEPPDQKPQGNNVQWIPGYWSWDTVKNDYIWISGVWRDLPPGRKWEPGYWNKVGNEYQWISGFWAPAGRQPPEFVPQPPASLDIGPNVPAPDAPNNFWLPGTWVFREGGFAWRPGFWTTLQPGWVWTAPNYSYTPSGYAYVPGYWDYPFEARGLLFAPVFFHHHHWRHGYSYRPSFVVGFDGLFGSLFVGPGYGSYYFGDYYSSFYGGLGFSPWYRYGRRAYDPLFSYYDRVHYHNPGWYGGLHNTYLARQGFAGHSHTALAAASGVRLSRGQTSSLVTPLSQATITNQTVSRITRNQWTEQRFGGQQIRDSSVLRAQRERLSSSAQFPQTTRQLPAGRLDSAAARTQGLQNFTRDNQRALEQAYSQRRSLYVSPSQGNAAVPQHYYQPSARSVPGSQGPSRSTFSGPSVGGSAGRVGGGGGGHYSGGGHPGGGGGSHGGGHGGGHSGGGGKGK